MAMLVITRGYIYIYKWYSIIWSRYVPSKDVLSHHPWYLVSAGVYVFTIPLNPGEKPWDSHDIEWHEIVLWHSHYISFILCILTCVCIYYYYYHYYYYLLLLLSSLLLLTIIIYIDNYRIIYIYTINYIPLIKYLVSHALRLRHIEAPLSNLWPSRPC